MKRTLSLLLVTALMLGLMAPLAQAAGMPQSNIIIENSTVTTLTPEQSIRLSALQTAARAAMEAETLPFVDEPIDDADVLPELPPIDGDGLIEIPLPEQPESGNTPDTGSPQEVEEPEEELEGGLPPDISTPEAPSIGDDELPELAEPSVVPSSMEISPLATALTAIANGATHNMTTASLDLTGGANFTVFGGTEETPAENYISLSNGTYEVTLQGVWMDCTNVGGIAAISLDNAELKLILSGTNTLIGSESRAGIRVPANSTLTIKSPTNGRLNVYAGNSSQQEGSPTAGDAGAGIGGNVGESNGPITFESGQIYAYAGSYVYNGAAGIGGGARGNGDNITILGGTVFAHGSQRSYQGAAGIGGGAGGSSNNITIRGGTTYAYASTRTQGGGAGIGGGMFGNLSNLAITAGTVYAYNSSDTADNGAAIGGGFGGSADTILIEGGNVTAYCYNGKDGASGAGIGGGGGYHNELTNTYTGGHLRDITITGGTINATGDGRGAGIGGGYYGNAENITITGGKVTATGGRSNLANNYEGGAGIGGGSHGYAKNIYIDQGDKTGSNSFVNATGQNYSAGIGGGSYSIGINIVLKNSKVTASCTYSPYGAGIGSGGQLASKSYVGLGEIDLNGFLELDLSGINDPQFCTSILIDNCAISASSSSGAGIGTGANVSVENEKNLVVPIQITNTTLTRAESGLGAGIGTGHNTAISNSSSLVLKIRMTDIDNATIRSTSGWSSGAAIGTGYQTLAWNGSVIDIDIDISRLTAVELYSYGYGACVGTGGYNGKNTGNSTAPYDDFRMTLNISITDSVIQALRNYSYGAGIGIGGQTRGAAANPIQARVIMDNVSVNDGYHCHGAVIGTGQNCGYYNATFTLSNCKKLSVPNYSWSADFGGAGIGTGSSNYDAALNIEIRDCGPIAMSFSNGAGIGTGASNYRLEVNLTLEGIDSIYLKDPAQNYAYGAGIGTGQNNYDINGKISIYNVNPFSGNAIQVDNLRYGTGIGCGYGNYLSNGSMYTGLDVYISDCGNIKIDQSGNSVGIGSGSFTGQSNVNYKGLPTSVRLENCGNIDTIRRSYDTTSGSVGIGTGANSRYPATTVSIINCGNISVGLLFSYEVGIGSGYTAREGRTDISIRNCGGIAITDTNTYAYKTGIGAMQNYGAHILTIDIVDVSGISITFGFSEQNTGIGMGYNCYGTTQNNITIRSTAPSNVPVKVAAPGSYATGIGMGSSCRENAKLNLTLEKLGDISVIVGHRGTGIGGGDNNYGSAESNVAINRCDDIAVECMDAESVAIGAGHASYDHSMTNVSILSSGNITANGILGGTGIGSAYNCYGANASANIIISDSESVTANGSEKNPAIGSGREVNGGYTTKVTIRNVPTVIATGGEHSAGIGSGLYNRTDAKAYIILENCHVMANSLGSSGIGSGDENSSNLVSITATNCTIDASAIYGAPLGHGNDAASKSIVSLVLTDCDTIAMSAGYSAGIGNGLRNISANTVIIVDGGSVVAIGAGGGAGIGAGPKGIGCSNDITIRGDAVVTATGSGKTDSVLAEFGDSMGSDAGAGIGGTKGQNGGAIKIEGGTVTSYGGSLSGYCAAGIGGGKGSTAGHVIISGGTVHARAGECPDCGAAGIGGGVEGSGGTIEIHDGHVIAIGTNGTRMGGAGMGGGQDGNGGTITITGGTINAIASERGAGIGGGSNGRGGTVTISGGKIAVTGGLYDTAGIGGGTNMSPGAGNDSTPLGGTLALSGNPELVVYGKSSNLAITAEITSSAPLMQATMLNFSNEARRIELENQSDSGIIGIDLPGGYMAFSATLLGNMGESYFARLIDDETYRLATTPDKVDIFDVLSTPPVIARNLNIIKYFDVTFDTGADGSAVPAQSVRIGDSVSVPDEAPTRLGYQFAGWFEDEQCTRSFDFTTAIEQDTTIYANWLEGEGVVYTVEHYKQELDGGYILANTEYFIAPHDTVVAASYLTYTGFHRASDHPDQVTSGLLYEGELLTLKLYYDRNILKLTIENIEDGPQVIEAMYGSVVVLQSPSKTGYDFDCWVKEDGTAVPDYPVPIEQLVPTIYAQWVLRDGVPYKVNHYLRNLSGSYVLRLSEDFAGVFGTEVEAVARSYEGFHLNVSISEQTGKGIVDPEGYLILRMFYDRDIITVNLADEFGDPATVSGEYGSIVDLPQRGKAGYIFSGWFKEDGTAVSPDAAVETLGETVYARWTANASVQYTVRHYQQNLADSGYTIFETEDLYGATDSTVTAVAKHYTGFHFSTTATQATSGLVSAETMLVLSVYYDRDLYSVTYNANGGSSVASQIGIKYKGRADEPAPPTRLGYDFAGWLKQDGTAYNFMSEVNDSLTLTAKWIARQDTDYRVQHYQQNITNNNYTLVDVEYLQGTTDTTAMAAVRSYTGFALYSEISIIAGKILPNGTTLLKIYYDRLEYTVTFIDRSETAADYNEVRHGAFVPVPAPIARAGYSFVAWCTDEELTMPWNFETGVVTGSFTLYAKWEPRLDVDFTVYHYQQDVTGDGYTLADTDELTGQADTAATAEAKDYTGFSENEAHADRMSSGNLMPDGSLILALYYDRNTFDVAFDAQDGSAVAAQDGIRYDGVVVCPVNPSRTGYTFAGWLLDGGLYNFDTPVTDSFILEATWTPNTYTVTYDYQSATSGNGTISKTVTYDAAYGTLPAPYRIGYNFAGWFTAQVGGAEVKADTIVKITDPQTLYARWSQGDGTIYKVQHFRQDIEGDGYTLHATDVLYGVTESEAFAETHPYTGFLHHTTHPDRKHSGIISADGQLVLSVYYDRDTFTVSFDSTGGSAVGPQSLRYQAQVAKPEDPTKLGYMFRLWAVDAAVTPFTLTTFAASSTPYIFASEVTSNLTLTAEWTANTDTPYKVEHYRQDVSGSGYTLFETDNLQGTTGMVVTAVPRSYAGFAVNTSHSGRVTSGTVLRDGSQVLKVYYDRQLYTVSFNSNGGSAVTAQSGIRYEGKTVQPTSPAKAGFVFAGWYANSSLTEEWAFDSPILANTTLYAKWEVQTGIPYTVRHYRQNTARTGYDLALTETLYAENGALVTASPRSYTGFHVNMELGTPAGTLAAETPLVLSVYYNRNSYTVTFDSKGGTAIAPITVIFGAAYGPLPSPTKDSSTFVSWHTVAGMEIKSTSLVDDSGDKTLYAQWHTATVAVPPSSGGGGGAPTPATSPEPQPSHDCPSLAYSDLDVGKWYHPYTDYVLANGLMVGTAPGMFLPDMCLTRAQAAMILARISDASPELPNASPFADVSLNHWAAAAIIWADGAGLMIGYGDGRFGPEDILTREQFALIICRISGMQETAAGHLDRFIDNAAVSGWAHDAMEWAVAHAILLGDDTHKLRPRDGITRTETSAILNRWLAAYSHKAQTIISAMHGGR